MASTHNFTHAEARQIAGLDPISEPWMRVIRHYATTDSNGLREGLLAALLKLDPTGGGRDAPDIVGAWQTRRGVIKTELDAKNGLRMLFCDAHRSWTKKLDWVCVFYEFDQHGLQFLADVEVSCCVDELAAAAAAVKNSPGRKHVSVPFETWASKPSARLLYKAEDRFPKYHTNRKGSGARVGDLKPPFQALLQLPYEPILEV